MEFWPNEPNKRASDAEDETFIVVGYSLWSILAQFQEIQIFPKYTVWKILDGNSWLFLEP